MPTPLDPCQCPHPPEQRVEFQVVGDSAIRWCGACGALDCTADGDWIPPARILLLEVLEARHP